MIFVDRKCWILTIKFGYTFFAGHPEELQLNLISSTGLNLSF